MSLETSTKRCYLEGFGECSGSISKEHYISAALLKYLDNKDGFKIGGLKWQEANTLQKIGVNRLQSKILCERHNSALSPLDAEAFRLFKALDKMDKSISKVPKLLSFDGSKIERWFLKVICGLSSSNVLSSPPAPNSWKEILTGAQWPEDWGLYLFPRPDHNIFTADFNIETKVAPRTGEIKLAVFYFAGLMVNLLLGKPGSRSDYGTFHPDALGFIHGDERREITFNWPIQTGQRVDYRRCGGSNEILLHRQGWKE